MSAAILVAAVSVAWARMAWFPISGMNWPHGLKRYETMHETLAPPPGAPSGPSGTVRLDCNGGDDADRMLLHAHGLTPNAACQIFLYDAKTKSKVGQPLSVTAEANGELKFTVYGVLCHFKSYSGLVVVVADKIVLQTEFHSAFAPRTPAPSRAPAATASTVPSSPPSATGSAAPSHKPSGSLSP